MIRRCENVSSRSGQNGFTQIAISCGNSIITSLETRDAAGAAGVVNQLIKQYPDELEPIYLGLKLSLLTTKKITYHSFRKLALSKGMPSNIIELFDFSFELMNHEQKEAMNRVADFEKEYPRTQFYATTLRYIAADFSSNDEMRIRKARKALLDSIEQYCVVELAGKKQKNTLLANTGVR